MELFKELNKLEKGSGFKKYYFMWRHKLKNRKTDYSIYDKDEFIEKYLKGSQMRFTILEQQWEKSEQYEYLVNLMICQNSANDLLEMFNSVREKAIEGDDKSIKTYLMLQGEIKNRLKPITKREEPEVNKEDDLDLKLD